MATSQSATSAQPLPRRTSCSRSALSLRCSHTSPSSSRDYLVSAHPAPCELLERRSCGSHTPAKTPAGPRRGANARGVNAEQQGRAELCQPEAHGNAEPSKGLPPRAQQNISLAQEVPTKPPQRAPHSLFPGAAPAPHPAQQRGPPSGTGNSVVGTGEKQPQPGGPHPMGGRVFTQGPRDTKAGGSRGPAKVGGRGEPSPGSRPGKMPPPPP